MTADHGENFEISGHFKSIDDLNRATQNIRLMFKHRPKFDGPYRSTIKRRKFGPIVLAEMESDPCVADRGTKESTCKDDFICITSQIHGFLQQRQRKSAINAKAGDLYIWDGQDPIEIDVNERIMVKTIWIKRSLFNIRSPHIDRNILSVIPSENPIKNILYRNIVDFHEMSVNLNDNQMHRITNSIVETALSCIEFFALSPSKTYDFVYQKCVDHIRSNIYDMYLSIDSLAQDTNISARSIQRAFTSKKTTFSAYLRQERLNEAARVLTVPNVGHLSMTDLAHNLAFYDLAHFSRSFKHAFGCSPTDFQRNIRK